MIKIDSRDGAPNKVHARATRAWLPFFSWVAVPLICFLCGTRWYWDREWIAQTGKLTGAPLAGRPAQQAMDIVFQHETEKSPWNRGTVIPPNNYIEVQLPGSIAPTRVEIQADSNDLYEISGGDCRAYTRLWTAPQSEGGGLVTRSSPEIKTQKISCVRIRPAGGDGRYSVSFFALHYAAWTIPHWAIGAALIAIAAILLLFTTSKRFSRFARPCIGAWAQADVYVALVIAFPVLFGLNGPFGLAFEITIGALVSGVLIRSAVKYGSPALLFNCAFVMACAAAFPFLFQLRLRQQISRVHDLTVDHRLKPDGKEINADGLRFRGTSADMHDGDFNVIFIGDSFTEGRFASYDDTYPYVTERLLAQRQCAKRVHVVNFGWSSSSPILGYRLLEDLGKKYKPNLVVYNLDLTDFWDDLHYEHEFKLQGPSIGAMELFGIFLDQYLGQGYRTALAQLRGALRRSPLTPQDLYDNAEVLPPRFFIVNQPLSDSIPLIEAGVMKNLLRVNTFVHDELKVPMIVVIYPRAFQYSTRESPRNWEANEYSSSSPYVLENFHYFEINSAALPFPVFSMLDSFRQSTQFPLYLDADPHWTPKGNEVAAQSMTQYLIKHRAVPCK